MIQTSAFDYINILDKAADASWRRESLITNNLANVNTPGYKRKDLNFEAMLQQEIGRTKYRSLDEKIKDVDLTHLDPLVYTDAAGYSYRMDGNNVDVDVEEAELASEQIKYQALTKSIDQEFARMKAVLS